MRVYFDACCLNRPFDDQSHVRIRLEAEAILLIMLYCEVGYWEWLSSEVMDWEIARTQDSERKEELNLLALNALATIKIADKVVFRAKEIEGFRIKSMDALHLACAEVGKADVFLTTDDILLKKARLAGEALNIRVVNPLIWIQEMENV